MNNPIKEGLSIQININGVPLKSVAASRERVKPTARADPTSEIADGLGVRLINRDVLNEEDMMKLEMEVTKFIRSMLSKKRTDVVKKFLIDHKDHFTSELKTALSDEITLGKITNGKVNR